MRCAPRGELRWGSGKSTGSALPWDEADLTSLLRWIRDVAVYELNYNHLDQGRELILKLLRS